MPAPTPISDSATTGVTMRRSQLCCRIRGTRTVPTWCSSVEEREETAGTSGRTTGAVRSIARATRGAAAPRGALPVTGPENIASTGAGRAGGVTTISLSLEMSMPASSAARGTVMVSLTRRAGVATIARAGGAAEIEISGGGIGIDVSVVGGGTTMSTRELVRGGGTSGTTAKLPVVRTRAGRGEMAAKLPVVRARAGSGGGTVGARLARAWITRATNGGATGGSVGERAGRPVTGGSVTALVRAMIGSGEVAVAGGGSGSGSSAGACGGSGAGATSVAGSDGEVGRRMRAGGGGARPGLDAVRARTDGAVVRCGPVIVRARGVGRGGSAACSPVPCGARSRVIGSIVDARPTTDGGGGRDTTRPSSSPDEGSVMPAIDAAPRPAISAIRSLTAVDSCFGGPLAMRGAESRTGCLRGK